MTQSAPKTVFDLTPEERRQYAEAVGRRGAERMDIARAGFRQLYPEAPDEMIHAAVFHVYVDGIDAAELWLAECERFLRDPSKSLHCGVSWDLLYHIYSWHMLEALMPCGRHGLNGLLDEINEHAAEGNFDAVQSTVAQIKAMLDGDEEIPQLP